MVNEAIVSAAQVPTLMEATAPLAAEPVTNPYLAPLAAEPAKPSSATAAGKKEKQPFSHQAAKFSVYAPFLLVAIHWAMNAAGGKTGNPNDARYLAIANMVLWLLVTPIALGLGVAGFVGGIRRGAVSTILLALLGIAIDALALWTWISVVFLIARRQ